MDCLPKHVRPVCSVTAGALALVLALAACSSKGDGRRGPDDLCDPVAQDCPDASQRCILVREGTDGPSHTECSGVLGDAGDREACVRPDGNLGEDTCAAGLVCVQWEMPVSDPQERHCLQYCHSDEDCEGGTRCQSLAASEWTGACTIECGTFAGTCGAGAGCYLTFDLWGDPAWLCQPAGAGLPGDPCTLNTDCAPLHTCAGFPDDTMICVALCNGLNPCEAGTCQVLGNTDGQVSYCHI